MCIVIVIVNGHSLVDGHSETAGKKSKVRLVFVDYYEFG